MHDVLVIGAGHAGCEAAAAAARRGARVGLADLPRRRCWSDVVQPVDRRRRQGASRPRTRRVRRPDGASRGSRRDPPPNAQPKQGAGGLGAAGSGRPAALPRCDRRLARRERRRDRRRRSAATDDPRWPHRRGRDRCAGTCRAARSSSHRALFSMPACSSATRWSTAGGAASGRRMRWPGRSARSDLGRDG